MKKNLMPSFVAAAAVDALGTGLYLTIYATFAVQVIGLSVGQAGAVLSVAGLVGLLGALPVVALLDRIKPYRLLICIYIVRAAGYAVTPSGARSWCSSWRHRLWESSIVLAARQCRP